MMKIDPNDYRVRPGESVELVQRPTMVAALCQSDKQSPRACKNRWNI